MSSNAAPKNTAKHSASCLKSTSYLVTPDDEPGAALLAASVRDVLVRITDVCAITGLSVPTIYRLMGRESFPRPVKITSTARAWKLSEIMAWVDSRQREEPASPDDMSS
jgi:prophage regulatory protein